MEYEWDYRERPLPDECDVCIIGSGAGGACVAHVLAKAGVKNIVVLERGIWRDDPRWNAALDNDELIAKRREMRRDALRGETEFSVVSFASKPTPTPSSKPSRVGTTFGVVGGYTVFYAAAYWRFRKADFKKRELYAGAYERASSSLKMDGTDLADWPAVGSADHFYDALEPYYAMAEDLIGVSGEDDEAGNPNRPPGTRRNAQGLPIFQPPLPYHRVNETLAAAARALEPPWRPMHTPMGISSVGKSNGLQPCVSCNFCSGYPCVWHAKNSVDDTLLRPIRTASNFFVGTGVVARRLEYERGKCVAVRYAKLDRDGKPTSASNVRLKCKLLVLAAGGVQSPRLLLLSNEGNVIKSPALGRYLMFHVDEKRSAWFNDPQLDADGMPVMVKKLAIMDRYLPEANAPFVNHYSIQTGSKSGPVAYASRVPRSEWRRFRQQYDVQTLVEDLPVASNAVTLASDTDPFGDPQAFLTHRYHPMDIQATTQALTDIERLLVQARATLLPDTKPPQQTAESTVPNGSHLMGTLRMGTSRETSVIDGNCRSHDVPNLFVVDGSVFPTSAGLNPALTIQANALRVADYLVAHAAEFGIGVTNKSVLPRKSPEKKGHS